MKKHRRGKKCGVKSHFKKKTIEKENVRTSDLKLYMYTKITSASFIIILSIMLFASSAESQTLKSISGRDTKKIPEIFVKFYNAKTKNDIDFLDIKTELTFKFSDNFSNLSDRIEENNFLLSDESGSFNLKSGVIIYDDYIGVGAGFTLELEIFISKKVGLLFTVNPAMELKRYTRFFGVWLTSGTKFYFTGTKFTGYISTSAGVLIQSGGIGFSLNPALGMEYKLNKSIKFNLETCPRILIPTPTKYFMILGISAGVGLTF